MSINCRSCKHFRGSLVVVPGEEPCHSCLTASSGWYPEYDPRSPEAPKKTNADMIRDMTDEELAVWMDDHCTWCPDPKKVCCSDDECIPCLLEWLKAPAEDGEHEQQE